MRRWAVLASLLLLVGCTDKPAEDHMVNADEVSTVVLSATNLAHSVTWQFSPEVDPLLQVADPLWVAMSGEQGVNPAKKERWVRLEGGTGFAQRGDDVWYLSGEGESEGPFERSLPQLPFMQAVYEIPQEQFGVIQALDQVAFRRTEQEAEREVWVAVLEPRQTKADLFGLDRELTGLTLTIEGGRPATYQVSWWAGQKVTVTGTYTWAEPAFPPVGPPKIAHLLSGRPEPLFTYEPPADLESRPIIGERYLTHPVVGPNGRPDLPFVVALHEADGTELWRWDLGLPTRGIFYVAPTPSQRLVAVVEGDFKTHLIDMGDGALITTLHPQKLLPREALTRVHLIADGAYLAMLESDFTTSEHLLQLYSVATGEQLGTYSGTYANYSAHSDLIVIQDEQGIELRNPEGLLGRLERPLPADSAHPLAVSGDSNEILIFAEDGVEVYNRNLEPLERYRHVSYAYGYGYQTKVLWEKTPHLSLRAWSPEGQALASVDISDYLEHIRVLPSGALWVPKGQQTCIVTPDAQPFGCFDGRLSSDEHHLWIDGGSTVRVYQMP